VLRLNLRGAGPSRPRCRLQYHAGRTEDLRTSLISHPDNGRVPQLVDGVRRVPRPQDLIAAIADPKGAPPLSELAGVLNQGRKDGPEDFAPSERCLFAAASPLVPELDGNYLQIVQGLDHIVLVCTDVEASLGFYCGELGLTPERVEEWRRGEVPFPSARISASTIIDLFGGTPSGRNLDQSASTASTCSSREKTVVLDSRSVDTLLAVPL